MKELQRKLHIFEISITTKNFRNLHLVTPVLFQFQEFAWPMLLLDGWKLKCRQ